MDEPVTYRFGEMNEKGVSSALQIRVILRSSNVINMIKTSTFIVVERIGQVLYLVIKVNKNLSVTSQVSFLVILTTSLVKLTNWVFYVKSWYSMGCLVILQKSDFKRG